MLAGNSLLARLAASAVSLASADRCLALLRLGGDVVLPHVEKLLAAVPVEFLARLVYFQDLPGLRVEEHDGIGGGVDQLPVLLLTPAERLLGLLLLGDVAVDGNDLARRQLVYVVIHPLRNAVVAVKGGGMMLRLAGAPQHFFPAGPLASAANAG